MEKEQPVLELQVEDVMGSIEEVAIAGEDSDDESDLQEAILKAQSELDTELGIIQEQLKEMEERDRRIADIKHQLSNLSSNTENELTQLKQEIERKYSALELLEEEQHELDQTVGDQERQYRKAQVAHWMQKACLTNYFVPKSSSATGTTAVSTSPFSPSDAEVAGGGDDLDGVPAAGSAEDDETEAEEWMDNILAAVREERRQQQNKEDAMHQQTAVGSEQESEEVGDLEKEEPVATTPTDINKKMQHEEAAFRALGKHAAAKVKARRSGA